MKRIHSGLPNRKQIRFTYSLLQLEFGFCCRWEKRLPIWLNIEIKKCFNKKSPNNTILLVDLNYTKIHTFPAWCFVNLFFLVQSGRLFSKKFFLCYPLLCCQYRQLVEEISTNMHFQFRKLQLLLRFPSHLDTKYTINHRTWEIVNNSLRKMLISIFLKRKDAYCSNRF